MKLKKVLLAITMMTLGVSTAMGDVIYYNTATGEIVGAFKQPVPTHPGFASATVTNADAITWPVPPGCPIGRLKWSVVANPTANPVAFALRPGLKFFKCQLVNSAADVDRVASEEIEKLQSGQSDAELLRQAVWAIYTLTLKCPPTDLSTQCNTDRTKAKTIETSLTGLNAQIETIQNEAADFKVSQGW